MEAVFVREKDVFRKTPKSRSFYHPTTPTRVDIKAQDALEAMATRMQNQQETSSPSSGHSHSYSSPGTNVPVWDLKVAGIDDGNSPASSRFNESWPSMSDEGEIGRPSVEAGERGGSPCLSVVPGLRTTMEEDTGAAGKDGSDRREGSTLMKYIERFRRAPPTHRGMREPPDQQFWWREAHKKEVGAVTRTESQFHEAGSSRDKKLPPVESSPKALSDSGSSLLSRSQDILDRSSVFLVSPLESPPAQKFWNSRSNLVGVAQAGPLGNSCLVEEPGNCRETGGVGSCRETTRDHVVVSPSEDILVQWRLRRKLEQARRESADLSRDLYGEEGKVRQTTKSARNSLFVDRGGHPLTSCVGNYGVDLLRRGGVESGLSDGGKGDVATVKTKPEELPTVFAGGVKDGGATRACGRESKVQTHSSWRKGEAQTSPVLLAGRLEDQVTSSRDIAGMEDVTVQQERELVTPLNRRVAHLSENFLKPLSGQGMCDEGMRQHGEGVGLGIDNDLPVSTQVNHSHPTASLQPEGPNGGRGTASHESLIGRTLLGKLTEGVDKELCEEERGYGYTDSTGYAKTSKEETTSSPPAHGGLALRHGHSDEDDDGDNDLLALSLTADFSSCATSRIHSHAPPSSLPAPTSSKLATPSSTPAPLSSTSEFDRSEQRSNPQYHLINYHSHSSTPSHRDSQQQTSHSRDPFLPLSCPAHSNPPPLSPAPSAPPPSAPPPSSPTPSALPPSAPPPLSTTPSVPLPITPPVDGSLSPFHAHSVVAGNSSKNGEHPPQKRSTLEALEDPLTWCSDMEDDLLKLLITKAQFFEAQISDIDQLLMAIELEGGVRAT